MRLPFEAQPLLIRSSGAAFRLDKRTLMEGQMQLLKRAAGRRRKRGIGRDRKLSAKQINTQLFVPDQHEFDKAKVANACSDAELIRLIVHEWAIKKRLDGRASDDVEMRVRKVHEKIVTEQVGPVRQTLELALEHLKIVTDFIASPNGDTRHSGQSYSTIPDISQKGADDILSSILSELSAVRRDINLLTESAVAGDSQGKQASPDQLEIQHLAMISRANYMLSGQCFTAIWAALDFVQRYLAEPTLKADPNHKEDPYQAAAIQLNDARKEGLEMVLKMSEEFRFPYSFPMVLIAPPEENE
jgi:hypothetical protein